MSGTGFKITVVYSVCGHSMLEEPGQRPVEGTLGEVSEYIPFDVVRLPLPRGFECRVGWCQTCLDHYRPDDINNVTAIDNYWRFKAQNRWVLPVQPEQVPRSAMFARPATTLVRSAMVDVSACLDSLFGQIHNKHGEDIRFLHNGGPKYIEAADLIRNSTLWWARWLEYQKKPLPEIPDPIDQRECHETAASVSANRSRHGRKGKPAPLLGLGRSRQGFLSFTDDQGNRFWVPGAHRTPTHMAKSAPQRTGKSLSGCSLHGRVDASCVDMTCHRCKVVFLDESRVSPGSKIAECHSAPAFPAELYARAAEGKCSCKVLKSEFCSSCRARAQVSERKEFGYGFF